MVKHIYGDRYGARRADPQETDRLRALVGAFGGCRVEARIIEIRNDIWLTALEGSLCFNPNLRADARDTRRSRRPIQHRGIARRMMEKRRSSRGASACISASISNGASTVRLPWGAPDQHAARLRKRTPARASMLFLLSSGRWGGLSSAHSARHGARAQPANGPRRQCLSDLPGKASLTTSPRRLRSVSPLRPSTSLFAASRPSPQGLSEAT